MTRDGVREDEIVWTGLRRYLAEHTGMVDRSELLAVIVDSRIRLAIGTESFTGFESLAPFRECCKRLALKRGRKSVVICGRSDESPTRRG